MNGGAFSEARAKGWTAVALPYRGRRLSMIAALPPVGRQRLPAAQTPQRSAASPPAWQASKTRDRYRTA